MNERTRHLIDAVLSGTSDEAEYDELMSLMMDDPEIEAALKRGETRLHDGLLEREAPARIPAMLAHAASFAVGIGLTLLVMLNLDDGVSVSQNVHVLETLRGEPALPRLDVDRASGPLTLVVYPGYEGLDALDVSIDRFTGDRADVHRAPGNAWRNVWRGERGVGNRDSLVLLLDADDYPPGVYRLTVLGITVDPPDRQPNLSLLFEIGQSA